MIRAVSLLAAAALVSASLPGAAQAQAAVPDAVPALTLEQQMLLRCSAAFAIISWSQDQGNAAALRYPRDEDAYREFFVRSTAQVMDQVGLTEHQIEAAVQSQAQLLMDGETLELIMPVCLSLLQQR